MVAMQDSDRTEDRRLTLTFWIAVVGVVAVLAALGLALLSLHHANDRDKVIPAMLGAVVAGIGTLVGAVAGHSAGASGKRQAEDRASMNERDAANGRALAKVMVADASGSAPKMMAAHAMSTDDPQTAAVDVARRHADLARSLFPDIAE
jgi:ABC-type uncharacterized transport system ATPase component